MKLKSFYLFGFLLGCTLSSATLSAEGEKHLIITKFLPDADGNETVTASSEFVEIYNPTGSAVDLSTYYITDCNNYYTISGNSNNLLTNTTSNDFCYKFPSAMLQPGQCAIVTQSARMFARRSLSMSNYATVTKSQIEAVYDSGIVPLIFETTDSGNTDAEAAPVTDVPKMIQAKLNPASPYALNFTNTGEFVALFQWDGNSPLVKDVDIFAYTDGTTAVQSPSGKSGVSVTRGSVTESYKTDSGQFGIGKNATLTIETGKNGFYRIFKDEVDETRTGGNGITGNDETTEKLARGWGQFSHTQMRTLEFRPGTPYEFQSASINSVERTVQNPGTSSDIIMKSVITDPAESVVSAKIYVDKSYPFAGGNAEFSFAKSNGSDEWNANIGQYAEGSYVKWYVEAVKSDSTTLRFPATGKNVFFVSNSVVSSGDVIINEIMYNPPGNDNETPDSSNRHAEWVELYNTTTNAIDLSYYRWSNNTPANVMNRFVFPEGTVIPAKGYLVMAGSVALFNSDYPDEVSAGSLVQFADSPQTGSLFDNDGNSINLVHVNSVNWNGTNVMLDLVSYSATAPWPAGTSAGNGDSIELIDPSFDNSLPASWRVSTVARRASGSGGTPGGANEPKAGVAGWSLY